jgi:hypothetical protein
MNVQQILDDMTNGTIRIGEYDMTTIANASDRLMQGDQTLSTHEFNSAAIVNGRFDLLDDDFRKALIEMGRTWAHATIAKIFDHWEREMALAPDHPNCPSGDQRIFTRRNSSQHV